MAELDKIRKHLVTRPRDLLLFELALQTQIPVHQLLKLRVGDIRSLNVGDALPFSSSLARRSGCGVMNPQTHHVLEKYLKKIRPSDSDFLFKSRKGDQPLSVPSVSRIIRGWLEETGLTHFSGLPGLRQALRKERSTNESEKKILSKVKKTRSIQQVVYEELEKAILSGQIPPGQKLVTEEISRMMGVSRIPVREAMGRLETRGLITTKPKWGSVVNALSRENLREISEIRLLLEPKAGAKAVFLIDKRFLSKLERSQKAFSEARKGAEAKQLLQTNRNFHFLIYEQAHSPMLLEIINQLWDRVSPYYHIMFRQSLERSPNIGVTYHENIFDSLKNKDEKAARHWIKEDLTNSTRFILRLFDQYSVDS